MLVPVSHKQGLSVHAFDDVLQGIQLLVMDMFHIPVIRIDRPVCHLGELAGQHSGICRRHLALVKLRCQILAHLIINSSFRLLHIHPVLAAYKFRHFEVVGGFHGNGDIGDLVIDPLLRSRQRLIGIHHLTIHPIWPEIVLAVLGDKPPQSLSHIQHLELGEQIHQAVPGRGTCKADNALCFGAYLHQRFEPLAVPVLEGRKLVHHDGVKLKGDILHHPLDVLPIDDIDVRIPVECLQPFFFRTHRHRIADVLQMIPLFNLLGPGIPRHPQRCDHQNAGNLEVVKQQGIQGRQRDCRLAKTHIKQYGGDLVCFNVLDGILLIIMWYELHSASPPISERMCGIWLSSSRMNTKKPSPRKSRILDFCSGRGFSPGALTSTKPHFPSGNRIRRSGTPENPGDTNFGAIPPLALTA